MAYKIIAERLRSHEILISNGIQDPVISSRMVLVGYRHEKMKKANTLVCVKIPAFRSCFSWNESYVKACQDS